MRTLRLALAIALTAPALFAQNWRSELNMVDRDLQAQRYAHARKWSIKMINSMCDHLGTGPDAMYSLALTVAYRAIAETGLGNARDGDWYWHVARSLYPKLAEKDWSAYGVAAKRSGDEEVRAAGDSPPPVPIRKVDPECPLSAIQGGYYESVTMAAVVDKDGNPRCPRLVAAKETPTLIYAAFEALRQFQFQPSADPAEYQLTVSFDPPRH